jgi:hypothetical protein
MPTIDLRGQETVAVFQQIAEIAVLLSLFFGAKRCFIKLISPLFVAQVRDPIGQLLQSASD